MSLFTEIDETVQEIIEQSSIMPDHPINETEFLILFRALELALKQRDIETMIATVGYMQETYDPQAYIETLTEEAQANEQLLRQLPINQERISAMVDRYGADPMLWGVTPDSMLFFIIDAVRNGEFSEAAVAAMEQHGDNILNIPPHGLQPERVEQDPPKK